MKAKFKYSLLLIAFLVGAFIEINAQAVVYRRPVRVAPVRVAAPVRVVRTPYVYPRVWVGAPVVVRTIPAAWVTVYFNGVPYYYCEGVYYVKTDVKDEYKPVQPQVGTIVPVLPEDAKKITIDGKVYYECQNVIYKKVIIEGDKRYEVVSIINN